MKFLRNLWMWLQPTPQTIEASIHTQMWVDGYSDFEIDMAIADYRKSLKDEDEVPSNV